jgi:putative (di)nucleoside polyphosphate hydrolase
MDAHAMASKYRPNVAGILERPEDGRIFIGERFDVPGAWQFPQGGIDKGESEEDAFFREMEEEIGLKPSDYEVVEKRAGYRYKFAKGRVKWGKYRGQEQTYFHCKLVADVSAIQLDLHNQEFSRFRWILPAEFDLGWLPEFKRGVYAAVLHDFFGIG